MASVKEIVVNGILTQVTEFDHQAQEIDDTVDGHKVLQEEFNDFKANGELKPTAHAATHAADGSDPITPSSIGAAAKPSYITMILLSSGWVDNTYSFEDTYPHAQYDISVEVSSTATADQFEAFGSAMICGSADSNVATALGDVPTEDIPIIVKAVRK